MFAWLALAAVVSSVLTVLVAGVLTRAAVEQRIVRELERQADAAASALAGGAGTQELRRFFAAQGTLLIAPGLGTQALGSGLLSATARGGRSGRASALGRSYYFASAEGPGGRVVLARPARLLPRDWVPYVPLLLLAGLVGAGVAAAVSYPVARRISDPVGRVSDATTKLASGDVSVRVPVEGEDELAHLAGSFNRMAEDLQAAREADRTFLLSVSHELKTPLTAIRGYAEALADGAASAEEAGPVIRDEAERLERLVQDLLDLARLEQRRFSIRSEVVELASIVRSAVERAAPAATELGVELTGEAAEGALALADPERLLQAVSNLVENALRSTPAGGRVWVRAEGSAIRVEDTGPGLSPEDLPRAFDRFYLHDRYGGDRTVGSGLGLAIVRELTEAMGGTVTAARRPEGGSIFTIEVPST